jgi:phage-related protein
MNTTISPVILSAKAAPTITNPLLIQIGTFYFTNFNIAIIYQGNTYVPWTLEFDGIKSSDANPLDGTTIKLANGGTTESNQNIVSSMILNNSITNAPVVIQECILNDDLSELGTYMIFSGQVDGRPGLDEQWATIAVAAFANPWTQRFPKRRITASCGWFFQDADCQYAGSLPGPCVKTYESCQAFGNTARFGGFRFAPAEGTRIAWGEIITVFN